MLREDVIASVWALVLFIGRRREDDEKGGMGAGERGGRELGIETFTIQPLMHIRLFALKPFFAFLCCPAEFAVLYAVAMRISLVGLFLALADAVDGVGGGGKGGV